MTITPTVQSILRNYEGETPGVKANSCGCSCRGRLAGTGKMIILPVDQGFEHGPGAQLRREPRGLRPSLPLQLAIDAGLSAYAAPLGPIEAGAETFAGQIPTILKVNSSNSLLPANQPKTQAITATVDDALRLGCAAIGFTIYPGSSLSLEMFEDIAEMRKEAAMKGVATVIWSYPRGEDLDSKGETAVDVTAYAAHIASLLGAHIVKVKLPTDHVSQSEAKKVYDSQKIDVATQEARVRHVVQACLGGRRIVVFSGGASKGEDSVIQDARDILAGGGNGSIIGRNVFQRPRQEAIAMLDQMLRIYQG
jgi:class I fructose-bisphosphate aldolase